MFRILKKGQTEVGIYKRKNLRKRERKHAFDQGKRKIQEKKKENKILTKKHKKILRSSFFSFINSLLREG